MSFREVHDKASLAGMALALLLPSAACAAEGKELYSAAHFAKAVENAYRGESAGESDYIALKKQAMEHLRASYHLSDRTVLTLVEFAKKLDYAEADQRSLRLERPFDQVQDFTRTLVIVDELIPLLVDRDWLVSRLLGRKAYCLESLDRHEEAYAVRERQFMMGKKIELEIDLEVLGDQLNFADTASRIDKGDRADRLYAFATTYPFENLFMFPKEFAQARDLVVRAARGLVNVRRGNAKKLEKIYLAPAIESEIRDELREARREAGVEAANPAAN